MTAQEDKTMYHLSVCIERGGKRDAFIVSAQTETQAVKWAEEIKPRIGYSGNKSFSEAVDRCSAMIEDRPGAWGILTTRGGHELP